MTSATIELYNALVKAGVEDAKAKQVAEDFVTRDEAKNFATKTDIESVKTEIASLEARMYKALAVQTIVVVGAVVGLLQLTG